MTPKPQKPEIDALLAHTGYLCAQQALEDAQRRGCTQDIGRETKRLQAANQRLLRANIRAGKDG